MARLTEMPDASRNRTIREGPRPPASLDLRPIGDLGLIWTLQTSDRTASMRLSFRDRWPVCESSGTLLLFS
jgi:hypothetical protein